MYQYTDYALCILICFIWNIRTIRGIDVDYLLTSIIKKAGLHTSKPAFAFAPMSACMKLYGCMNYIMPPIPPMPPIGGIAGIAGAFSSTLSATIVSVVNTKEAIDAAF